VKQWKPIGWAVERGQLDGALAPFMRERQQKRNIYVAMEKFPTKGDKTIRCQSIRGRLATNPMLVPMHAPWWPEVRAELLSFPAAAHDDTADVLGLVGQILDRMSAPRVPTPKEEPKRLMIGGVSNVCMEDLWREHDRKARGRSRRIR
jgi:hypothetical protein